MKVLLRHVPSHKVHWGKRILSTMQNGNGAMVRVADGTTFHGDIIVGADGAYSAVRQSLYKNMAAKGLKVSSHNTQPLRFELLCVLGTTRPLGDKYPVLNEPTCKMDIVLASKEISYSVFATSVPGGRVAWAIGGHFLSERIHDQESFRQTELGSESLDGIRKVLDNVRIPLGGTIGEMIEATDNVSNILVEDKLFSVWSEGRTVLMGDAAHKLTFAGGQGANQAILDGVCLANLLHEMPTGSLEDLKRVFTKYQEIRFPPAKKCIEGSAQLSKLMSHQGRFADFLRSIALNIPLSLTHRAHDAIFTGRPILNYMDPIPLKGSKKDTSKPHKLDKPKDAVSI
ncbi:hypothetical protein BGZ73_007313 [Actinomortierella ambigua]|nr:hypothetical protein BGZ73_007313 [Actinomortierella ambigua]